MDTRNLSPGMELTAEMITAIEANNSKLNQLTEQFADMVEKLAKSATQVTHLGAKLKLETDSNERQRGQIQAYEDITDRLMDKLKDS